MYCQTLNFEIISFSLNCFSFVDLALALCPDLVFKLYTKLVVALCCCMQCSDRLAFLLPDQCGLKQVQVNRSRCSIYWALTSVQKSWEINSNMLIIQIVWTSNVRFFFSFGCLISDIPSQLKIFMFMCADRGDWSLLSQKLNKLNQWELLIAFLIAKTYKTKSVTISSVFPNFMIMWLGILI